MPRDREDETPSDILCLPLRRMLKEAAVPHKLSRIRYWPPGIFGQRLILHSLSYLAESSHLLRGSSHCGKILRIASLKCFFAQARFPRFRLNQQPGNPGKTTLTPPPIRVQTFYITSPHSHGFNTRGVQTPGNGRRRLSGLRDHSLIRWIRKHEVAESLSSVGSHSTFACGRFSAVRSFSGFCPLLPSHSGHTDVARSALLGRGLLRIAFERQVHSDGLEPRPMYFVFDDRTTDSRTAVHHTVNLVEDCLTWRTLSARFHLFL